MMPEVERWMAGPGRETLLETVAHPEEEASLAPCIKILGEMHESRVSDSIISYLDSVRMLSGTQQALAIEAMCYTLVRLDNKQALPYIQHALEHTVDTKRRASHPKQRDYLPAGDGDIPGSIVYAAAIRAYGQFGDRETLSTIQGASTDLDPYVRSQALSALRQLDPQGEDMRSRFIARDLLNDPNDAIAASACQLVARYHDGDAVSSLRYLADTRAALAGAAREALRQLGQ
jgi:HEAT repeat protein